MMSHSPIFAGALGVGSGIYIFDPIFKQLAVDTQLKRQREQQEKANKEGQ